MSTTFEQYEQAQQRCQQAADDAAYAGGFFQTQQRNNNYKTPRAERDAQFEVFAQACKEYQQAFEAYQEAATKFYNQ